MFVVDRALLELVTLFTLGPLFQSNFKISCHYMNSHDPFQAQESVDAARGGQRQLGDGGG